MKEVVIFQMRLSNVLRLRYEAFFGDLIITEIISLVVNHLFVDCTFN